MLAALDGSTAAIAAIVAAVLGAAYQVCQRNGWLPIGTVGDSARKRATELKDELKEQMAVNEALASRNVQLEHERSLVPILAALSATAETQRETTAQLEANTKAIAGLATAVEYMLRRIDEAVSRESDIEAVAGPSRGSRRARTA